MPEKESFIILIILGFVIQTKLAPLSLQISAGSHYLTCKWLIIPVSIFCDVDYACDQLNMGIHCRVGGFLPNISHIDATMNNAQRNE